MRVEIFWYNRLMEQFTWFILIFCLLAGGARADAPVAHMGAFASQADFARMSADIYQHKQPQTADFLLLRSNPHDSPDYTPHPVSVVVRGTAPNHPPENYAALYNDAAAAYALALDWRVSKDPARAARAAYILMAWAETLRSISGTSDKYLASGIYGYQLAVAAETLRGYKGWSETDQQKVAAMLLNVFVPMNLDFLKHHNGQKIDHYWANWDLANTASLMAIGVFTNRADLYNFARTYYLYGAGNGSILHAAWKLYPDGLAQWQESGRDQGHSLLGIGLAGVICQIAWEQGDNLFAADNNRLLAAARYIARYNLGKDVPYTPYQDSDAVQLVISPQGRGEIRPVWVLFYAHYVLREHLYAPELAEIVRREGPEGGGGNYGPNSGGFDQLGYGTMTFIH